MHTVFKSIYLFDIELGASEMIIYGTTTEFDQTNPNPDADSTFAILNGYMQFLSFRIYLQNPY